MLAPLTWLSGDHRRHYTQYQMFVKLLSTAGRMRLGTSEVGVCQTERRMQMDVRSSCPLTGSGPGEPPAGRDLRRSTLASPSVRIACASIGQD